MASADIDIDGVVSALLKEYGYKEPEPRETDGAGNASAPKSARTAPDANILARLAERRAAAEQREEVYCEVCGLVRVKSGSAGVPACERCYKRMAVLREGRKEAIEFYSDPRNTRRSSRRVKKYIQGILAANQGRDLEIREDDIPPRPAPAEKPAAPVAEKPAAPASAPAAAAPARAGRLSAAEILAQFEDAPAEKKPAAPAAEKPIAPAPAAQKAPAAPVAEKPVAPAPEPMPVPEPTPAPKKGKLAARKEKAAAAKAAAVAPAAEKPPIAYTPEPASAPAAEDEPSIDELLARIGEFSEEEDVPVSRSERRQMAEASVSRIERRAAEAKAAIEAEISPPPISPRAEKHSPEAVSRRAARPAAPAAAAPANGKPSLEEMLTPIGGAAGPLSARDGRRAQPASPATPHNEPSRAPMTETPRPPAAKPPVPAAERRPAAHTAPEVTPPASRAAAAAPGNGKPSLEEMLTPIGGAQESGLSRRNRRKSAPESPVSAPRQPAAATPAPPARAERSAAPERSAPAADRRPTEETPSASQPSRRTPQPASAPAANHAAHAPRAAERSIDEILADIAMSEGEDIPTEEMLSRAERALQGGSAPRKESAPASVPAPHSPRMAERRTARPDVGGAPPAPAPRQNERMARKAYRPAFALNRVCQACGADEWVGIDGTYSYIELCNNCERRKVEYKKQDYVDSFECPYCGGLTGTREENKRKFGVRCSNCGELTICFQKVDELMMDEKLTAALTGYAKALVSEEVTCPQCGSESITTGTKGIAFFGGGKPVNRCARCGFTWTPEWTVG